jgi:hypothetical protein
VNSLDRLHDGRARCGLWLGHRKRDELLDSESGCLSLYLSNSGDRVTFRLDTNCAGARRAARAILTGGFQGWSLGCRIQEFRQVGPRRFIVDRADVQEISAVTDPADPACFIRATIEDRPPRCRQRHRHCSIEASVPDVSRLDLALVDLLQRGRTSAPAGDLAELAARGQITFTPGGRPVLTKKGRRRAERLEANEHDLRRMFPTSTGGGGILAGEMHRIVAGFVRDYRRELIAQHRRARGLLS